MPLKKKKKKMETQFAGMQQGCIQTLFIFTDEMNERPTSFKAPDKK